MPALVKALDVNRFSLHDVVKQMAERGSMAETKLHEVKGFLIDERKKDASRARYVVVKG